MIIYVDSKTKEIYSAKSQIMRACQNTLTLYKIATAARECGYTEKELVRFLCEGMIGSGNDILDYCLNNYINNNIVSMEIKGNGDIKIL